jgi:tRNA-specific 2-thiouridylase
MNREKIKIKDSERSRRIVVAMSGGVDSSVAAALLKKQGYFVVGVFMKFWKEGNGAENRCCSIDSEKRARQVAKILNIPFYVLNVEKEFKKKVVDYFLEEYKKGNTPNPCVVCNKEIKFGFLINRALKMGVEFIATGHYAQIHPVKYREAVISARPKLFDWVKNNKLLKGKDKKKDQSYFLWQLNQKQLSRVLFPVGNYTKPEVRALAKKFELPVAETPESQEVCFIQNKTNDFLKKYLKSKPGKIIDVNGKILGKHQGLWFYTIGQRRGIGFSGGPYFVVTKDLKNNNLIVSKNQKDLEKKQLIVKNVNWTNSPKLPLQAEIKIRYKSNIAIAKILDFGKNKVKIVFQKSQKAVTPGQSAVFYKGEEMLGGGTIE